MIRCIVSGGQSGADQAGWRTAKRFGIPTAGWMPRGFLTEDGPRPEFADLYGAKAMATTSYPARTRRNVNEACILLWFGDPKSRGGRLTLGWARTRGLVFAYTIEHPRSEWDPAAIARHLANALEQSRLFPLGPPERDGTVLVAGNRESSWPGIGAWVETFLCDVFRLLDYREV